MWRRGSLWLLVVMLALACPPVLAAGVNQPGSTTVTIHYQDEDIVGGLGSASYDQERKQMGVCFASTGLAEHVKLEQSDGNLSIIVPVLAVISVDGKTLNPVDATFFKHEAWWFFDTKDRPDTVTFYPFGGEPDGPDAVTVDGQYRTIMAAAPAEPVEAEPAEAPEPSEAPAAPASALSAVDIDRLLSGLAEDAEDPWVKAILQAGCGEVDAAAGTIALRSFDPGLSDMPSYAEDPEGWLAAFGERIARFDLSVPVELEGGAFSEAGERALLAAVKKAAAAAKSAFDEKQVRVAIADHMLPSPVAALKAASDLEDESQFSARFVALTAEDPFLSGEMKWYAPLLYAQSKQSLSVKGGPHALVLTATGADPEAMAERARMAALAKLSKLPADERDQGEGVEAALMDELVNQAAALRKGGGSEHRFELDIDDLFDGYLGADYEDYIVSYRPGTMQDQFLYDVESLPEQPSLDFPKTGRLSGSKSGTQLNIKAPSDEMGRYVQVRDADTGEKCVDMFIRPGATCTVRVPKGMYYLTVATGSTWYGEEALFGPSGYLSKTEDMEVMSSSYYHNITLQVTDGGNMSTYGASAADFE